LTTAGSFPDAAEQDFGQVVNTQFGGVLRRLLALGDDSLAIDAADGPTGTPAW
jgi:hypothetical protein